LYCSILTVILDPDNDALSSKFIVSFGLEKIVKLNLSWDLFLNYIRETYQYTFYLYFKQLFIPDVFNDGINGIRTMSFYEERNIKMNDYFVYYSSIG